MSQSEQITTARQLCDQCIASGATACPHESKAFDNVPEDALIGKVIGDRYQVEAFIGSGGWGRVYRVMHSGLNKVMALKMLHSSHVFDREKLQRFKQEAEAISNLDHPNICRVLDFAEGPERQPCMVMELLEGLRLDERIKTKPLPLPEVLEIAVQLCSALAATHKKGIIHRDLKPSNIILTTHEEKMRVKVLDFGLAKVIDEESQTAKSLTETGLVIGTPAYMSPEQCFGRQVDARTDIYSLGCILYEAITGRKAFDGPSLLEIMNAHMDSVPKSFTQQTSSETERSFEAMLLKAMDKAPELRYQAVEELEQDLRKLQSNQKVVISLPRPKRAKNKWLMPVIAGAVATALIPIAFFGYMFWQTQNDWTPVRHNTYEGMTLADLNKAIEANPHDARAFYQRGRYHELRDERDNAIEDFSMAIKLNPEYTSAYRYRSEMYLMTANYAKALADANMCIKIAPQSSIGWAKRARIEALTENYNKALEDSRKALYLDKWDASAMANLSAIYSALGDHQKAYDAASRNFDSSDGGADDLYWSHYERAVANLRANDFESAINDYRTALLSHRKMSQAWAELAHAHAALGQMDEAQTAMSHALSLDTFPARAHRLQGEMYRAAGEWTKASQEYSTSTSLEPWYGPGFTQRAEAEIALGQMNSAKLDLEKSIKLLPDSAEAFSYLALVEDQLGDTPSADAHIKKAFALTPNLPVVFLNRARIEMRRGEFAAALKDLNQAIQFNNRMSSAYATRAILLDKLQQPGEAEADRKVAAQLRDHAPEVPLTVANAANSAVNIEIVRPQISKLTRKDTLGLKYRSLPPEQAWAVNASNIWMDNRANMFASEDTLSPFDESQENSESQRQSLKQGWGIENKNEALEAITELSAPTDTAQDTAFQLVRAISLVRMAYQAEYLSEDEAWKLIMPMAKRIQSQFHSWDELSKAYLKGRVEYYSGEPEDHADFTAKVRKWLTDKERLSSTVPFDTALI